MTASQVHMHSSDCATMIRSPEGLCNGTIQQSFDHSDQFGHSAVSNTYMYALASPSFDLSPGSSLLKCGQRVASVERLKI